MMCKGNTGKMNFSQNSTKNPEEFGYHFIISYYAQKPFLLREMAFVFTILYFVPFVFPFFLGRQTVLSSVKLFNAQLRH